MKNIIRKKYFLILPATLILFLAGFFIAPARAGWVNHLVISAVQTKSAEKTTHDFIEIYNPANQDINLGDYRLVKRAQQADAKETSIKAWDKNAVIKAHGWRLWASSDDAAFPASIGADDFTGFTIADNNGIAIRSGAMDTGEIIDSAAWGAAENIFREGNLPANPGVSESLVRKPDNGSGNGEDTNNNFNDFIKIANFVPRASQSAAAPFLENLPASNLTPTPTPSPSAGSSSGPVASVPVVQKNLPTAEAGQDKEAALGENIDFDGSDSFDPRGKELVLTWDFGDKTGAKGANVSHIYNADGEYSVILKADNGENISEDSLNVKISAPEFSDKIIISEILPNPIGVDKDGEWIEFFNSGDKRVNLRGWILTSSAKTSGKQYLFSGDNFIEPNGYLLIKRSQSNLVLANAGGETNLLFPPDKILSKVSYGEAKEGKSYALVNNNWQWADVLTPGEGNISAAAGKTAKSAAEAKNIIAAASDSSNAVLSEGGTIADEELAFSPNSAGKIQTQSNAIRMVAFSDLEKYLGKTIGDEISAAVSNLAIRSAEPPEKISGNNSFESPLDGQSAFAAAENAALAQQPNARQNTRNNPWFWGDMALSALSLFLVWRYQEVKKRTR